MLKVIYSEKATEILQTLKILVGISNFCGLLREYMKFCKAVYGGQLKILIKVLLVAIIDNAGKNIKFAKSKVQVVCFGVCLF